MSVKMRLIRLGDKKSPFYRIVVIDSRKARDGEYIDLIGTYNPLTQPAVLNINEEKAKKWLDNGVQPTDTVRALLVSKGLLEAKKYVAKKKIAPPAPKAKAEEEPKAE